MFWHNVLCPLSSNSSQKHRYRQRRRIFLHGCDPFSKRSARPQTFINFMWLVYSAARQPNKKTVRLGLSNSYPYDKNFSILAPYIYLCGKLMTHKNANFEQTSTWAHFWRQQCSLFYSFQCNFPLYIYTEFCNVHPRVTASSRFLRDLPLVLE